MAKRIVSDPTGLSQQRKGELLQVISSALEMIKDEERDEGLDVVYRHKILDLFVNSMRFGTFEADAVYSLMPIPQTDPPLPPKVLAYRKDMRKRTVLHLSTELMKSCHPSLVDLVNSTVTTKAMQEVFENTPSFQPLSGPPPPSKMGKPLNDWESMTEFTRQAILAYLMCDGSDNKCVVLGSACLKMHFSCSQLPSGKPSKDVMRCQYIYHAISGVEPEKRTRSPKPNSHGKPPNETIMAFRADIRESAAALHEHFWRHFRVILQYVGLEALYGKFSDTVIAGVKRLMIRTQGRSAAEEEALITEDEVGDAAGVTAPTSSRKKKKKRCGRTRREEVTAAVAATAAATRTPSCPPILTGEEEYENSGESPAVSLVGRRRHLHAKPPLLPATDSMQDLTFLLNCADSATGRILQPAVPASSYGTPLVLQPPPVAATSGPSGSNASTRSGEVLGYTDAESDEDSEDEVEEELGQDSKWLHRDMLQKNYMADSAVSAL
eukprot:gene25905-31284_t